ncbi:MAG TPA: Holliday junction branch migration protein RuvA [Acidimicrobiales bacterium]|nr:Holliday junction branch migration protein RuvA [Acidimicrobiales bacterium]
MIGSLRGQILDRLTTGELLVDVNGVGYRVQVPTRTLVSAGDLGDTVFLHVHTHVREDAIVLYGFATSDERVAFEALLSAHKVGPALALAVLSHLTPMALRRAVASDDLDALCAVPGIGKTTAARLLLDLKTKLALDADPEATLAAVNGDGASLLTNARADVRNALANLGYGPDEISYAVRDLPDDGDDASDLLRVALKTLAAAR